MGGGIINLTPVDTCAGSGGEENIIDFAHDDKIDLLVISTHGSGGLSRWNISSVIEKVINLIYLPVLIVRAYSQCGGADARIRYRGILLPIDSSRRAEYSLSAGIALAQGETSMGYASEADNAPPDHSASDTSSLSAKLVLAAFVSWCLCGESVTEEDRAWR